MGGRSDVAGILQPTLTWIELPDTSSIYIGGRIVLRDTVSEAIGEVLEDSL